jgi:hypothetical protein
VPSWYVSQISRTYASVLPWSDLVCEDLVADDLDRVGGQERGRGQPELELLLVEFVAQGSAHHFVMGVEIAFQVWEKCRVATKDRDLCPSLVH